MSSRAVQLLLASIVALVLASATSRASEVCTTCRDACLVSPNGARAGHWAFDPNESRAIMGREPGRLPITCVRSGIRFVPSAEGRAEGRLEHVDRSDRDAAKCRDDVGDADLAWAFANQPTVARELLRISAGRATRHFECRIEHGEEIRLRLLGYEAGSRPGLLQSVFTWQPR